jgi:hypothetical protein
MMFFFQFDFGAPVVGRLANANQSSMWDRRTTAAVSVHLMIQPGSSS